MSTHVPATTSKPANADTSSSRSRPGPHGASITPPAHSIGAAERASSVKQQAKSIAPADAALREPPAARGGLPPQLVGAIRAMAGIDLADVRVHANSVEPGRMGAAAFAAGNDIHLAPNQERHLPHEAWHVVQQMQGRVRPTTNAGGVPVNDDPALEREADEMGRRAAARSAFQPQRDHVTTPREPNRTGPDVAQRVIATDRKYIGDDGPKPRFGEAFALKHLLNADDSSAADLQDPAPLDKRVVRGPSAIPNTGAAYAQAMKRFNTGRHRAAFTHILEPSTNKPRPGPPVLEQGGTKRHYPFDCERAWKFELIDKQNVNNPIQPDANNQARYEARLAAVLDGPRTAKLMAIGTNGVIDHWDQRLNGSSF